MRIILIFINYTPAVFRIQGTISTLEVTCERLEVIGLIPSLPFQEFLPAHAKATASVIAHVNVSVAAGFLLRQRPFSQPAFIRASQPIFLYQETGADKPAPVSATPASVRAARSPATIDPRCAEHDGDGGERLPVTGRFKSLSHFRSSPPVAA
jgi:hypothetical protein